MKSIRYGLQIAAVMLAAAASCALAQELRTTNPVGFQQVAVPDAGRAAVQLAVWYPTQASPRPTALLGLSLMSVALDAPVTGTGHGLIVMSHGNGGGPGSHADLALALADNGFVVAAPMHTGDNFTDQSAVGSAHWLPDRSRHIQATLDYMLKVWPGHAQINAGRVGVFGFSAGGFTALAAIGGEPDLRRIASHCAVVAEFACKLLAESKSVLMQAQEPPAAGAPLADARIKAAVIVAPGLGFTFVPDGLTKVRAKVQLWSGQQDTNVPEASNAGPVHAALGARSEFHAVPGAGHFSFLVPCSPGGPPFLCADAEGFDRRAFHADMNRQVVGFFEKNL